MHVGRLLSVDANPLRATESDLRRTAHCVSARVLLQPPPAARRPTRSRSLRCWAKWRATGSAATTAVPGLPCTAVMTQGRARVQTCSSSTGIWLRLITGTHSLRAPPLPLAACMPAPPLATAVARAAAVTGPSLGQNLTARSRQVRTHRAMAAGPWAQSCHRSSQHALMISATCARAPRADRVDACIRTDVSPTR